MNFIEAVGDWKSNDEWRYADKEAAWKFFFAAGKESSQTVISAQCVKMSQYESIIFELRNQLSALKEENETAWAQAHRLALELECLLLDTKDNAIVSKWWDSGMEALNEYQELQPGAAESAEAWAKTRKAGL